VSCALFSIKLITLAETTAKNPGGEGQDDENDVHFRKLFLERRERKGKRLPARKH